MGYRLIFYKYKFYILKYVKRLFRKGERRHRLLQIILCIYYVLLVGERRSLTVKDRLEAPVLSRIV